MALTSARLVATLAYRSPLLPERLIFSLTVWARSHGEMATDLLLRDRWCESVTKVGELEVPHPQFVLAPEQVSANGQHEGGGQRAIKGDALLAAGPDQPFRGGGVELQAGDPRCTGVV